MAKYTPAQVARQLAVPDRTLRYWSSRFAAYLSPAAVAERTEKGSGHRRFADADLEVLSTIRDLAARRVPLRQIDDALRERTGLPSAASLGGDLEPSLPAMSPSPLPAASPAGEAAAARPPVPPARWADAAAGYDRRTDETASPPRREPPPPTPLRRSAPPPAWLPSSAPASPGPSRDERLEDAVREQVSARFAELAGQIGELRALVGDLQDRLDLLQAASGEAQQAARPWWSRWWPFSLFSHPPAPTRGDLARRIARLMAERMITRQELARQAGVSAEQIQALLSGRQSQPAPALLAALARALGVRPDELSS